MKNFGFLFSLIILTAVCSCSKNDEPEMPVSADRTVLVYMAANNNLADDALDIADIREMVIAAKAGGIGEGNHLIVFHGSRGGGKTLFEIDNRGNFDTIAVYTGPELTVSADFMLQVFSDVKSYTKSSDYGLILWSHALGWTNNGRNETLSVNSTESTDDMLKPLTWGNDKGYQMNLNTLARVLEISPWSWVYFDCCFMGCVEVAYELAPVVDTMVGSATELYADGMPYDRNIPLFFKPEADLVGAARNTYEYYMTRAGLARTCTISVFDLREMDNLAKYTASVYEKSTVVGAFDFPNLPLKTSSSLPPFYDFGVYVDGLCEVNGIDSALHKNWEDAYKKVVVYYAATPKLWNEISLTDFTGMSTYIPANSAQENLYNYTSLRWYEDVARFLYHKGN